MYRLEKRQGYFCVLCGSVVVYRHSIKRCALEWLAENELKQEEV